MNRLCTSAKCEQKLNINMTSSDRVFIITALNAGAVIGGITSVCMCNVNRSLVEIRRAVKVVAVITLSARATTIGESMSIFKTV